ncbi:MAG: ABC transporter ATP-binding protein/permease [Pseudodesulfovibrio sp.]|uniref:ABC transporter related protein n=1 Tax=Pseudodesulfovibrio aespoeensis (strain ATCC 700646 / DSM 10631 / Aspo-2) TaxID=643562 RepID=E6VYC7_PSEA9|nr:MULTISPECIES: ABC transporter ATP-binding protein [Pseudodesulfovibrio]ADU61585.1 ABC transporter related protein [Pseudodesulfovibrio aespoeensis Aspo-2]MBV1765596.1 ABC transporter ATP-binding protein/permease [Pseudodesulfovibrio sp.]MBV1773566.1 ABC transporter ATP-binding protein/permease [Pseudodesulfovibrio sp.]MCG2733675.1 ABC transporter ATP-binding protein/permease [Pseudodesulfovibrio aespoeensis]
MRSQEDCSGCGQEHVGSARHREERIPGIWELMRPVRAGIRTAIAMSAIGSVAGLAGVAALALVVTALLGHDPRLWVWVCLSIGLTLVSILLRVQAFTVSHLAAFKLEVRLRTGLTDHLARIPLGYLLGQGSGVITKVVQDDVKNLHAFVADSTPLLGRGVATPVVTLALLLAIDWRLALVALGVLLVGALAVCLCMRGKTELQRRYDAERERINGTVVEFVQAMPVVRTFDDGAASFGRYQAALDGFKATMSEWLRVSGTSGKLAITVLAPMPTLLALTLGGLMLYHGGDLDFASWAAVLLLGTGMAESLAPLMWLNFFIRKANASARRIHELMAVPELPASVRETLPQDASVTFENVSFAYEGRDDDALIDIGFTVPTGTVTALVGPSGAGKSTVARLIPRFWDVRRGAVRIGGADVRDMTPQTLMGNVSFVFQDAFLFHDTIAANIRMGRPDASMEEVEQAARAAQAHDFISELPNGYEAMAGERGTRLSGGQRQRITIARAILQGCPVVVLDEATAFADPENEAALIAALANLMKGRTVIIIAHRLSTIRDADQIVVLDYGRVAESGRHDGLVAAGGVYARLWDSYERARGWTLGRGVDAEA